MYSEAKFLPFSEIRTDRKPISGFDTILSRFPDRASLATLNWDSHLYTAQVQSLTNDQLLNGWKDLFLQKKSSFQAQIEWIRASNYQLLKEHGNCIIVLDGRAQPRQDGIIPTEGYLGDMLESSRMVNSVEKEGIQVTIATPHPKLFEGAVNTEILPLPPQITGMPNFPWNDQLRQHISMMYPETPIIFPLNGQFPIVCQLDELGNFSPMSERIERFVDNFVLPIKYGSDGGKILKPERYAKKGFHQLHALQMNAYLFGLQNTSIEPAFIHPNQDAQDLAERIVQDAQCFAPVSEDDNNNTVPVYIHIGVATGSNKIRAKYYPKEQWMSVLTLAREHLPQIRSLTFLRPTDNQQAKDTIEISRYARELGFRVSEIPLHRNFTLGVFMCFLKELQRCNGLVIGCDSMPVGHAASITGNYSVVLGSLAYPQHFYCPENKATVVMPPEHGVFTSTIPPTHIIEAISNQCLNILNR